MSVELKSQDSDSECDQSDHMDEEEDDYCGYYDNDTDDLDIDKPKSDDPEKFEFEMLQVEDVERLLNEEVEALCSSEKITPGLAKMLLQAHTWNREYIIEKHKKDPGGFLVQSNIMPAYKVPEQAAMFIICPVCMQQKNRQEMCHLSCGHSFCKNCWDMFFQVQIQQGITTTVECMAKDCNVMVPEDFLCNLLSKSELRERYSRLIFMDNVKSHPQLRFCPGPNCSFICKARNPKAKKVECSNCKTHFCFKCGIEYHAPTDCDIIKKWLTKCADDSETANYISGNTKDCPKCHVCIEKNGGCNHMQCTKCKYDFCWMCLQDWKTHGSEYYECSRYKENPNIANESVHVQAREALKKYLFYFERWENHAKSLKLEEQTLEKILSRIQIKVMNNEGTWIDWQYLLDATYLLRKTCRPTKNSSYQLFPQGAPSDKIELVEFLGASWEELCRYTLQYTYPYAYYMDKGGIKQLFEYQQAQLEAEVENLSWKIERAEITDRGDLENQMDIAEKRRQTLLKDFLDV